MCLHPWLGSILHQFLFFYSGTIRARGKVSWATSSMEDTLNYQEVQSVRLYGQVNQWLEFLMS